MDVHLSTAEVARYLKLGERTVYELLRKGRIPAARIGGKWLFPRAVIDRWVVDQIDGRLAPPPSPPPVLAGSHDPLLEWALREVAGDLALLICGSAEGLARLADGRAAVAAVHLAHGVDDAPFAPDTADHGRLVVVEWARREQGLVVAPGNPLRLAGLADVVAKRAQLVRRQPGAGADLLLRRLAEADGLALDGIDVAPGVARTEAEVGERVADGRADCGLAIRAVATRLGLDHVPLRIERFDLVTSRDGYFSSLFQPLLELTRTAAFRRHARALGGYDLRHTGRILSLR
jgi:excisionase family DNA binding protein